MRAALTIRSSPSPTTCTSPAPLLDDPAERLPWPPWICGPPARPSAQPPPVWPPIYLRAGWPCCPPDAWEPHHGLTFALYLETIETAHADGDVALAQPLFDEALARCDSLVEKAALYHVCVSAAVVRGGVEEALRLAAEGLRLLGVELPASETDPAIGAEIAAVEPNLRGREVADLLATSATMPELPRACMQLLGDLIPAVYTSRPGLAAFILARRVNLCLAHGHAPGSARSYVDYAALSHRRGDTGRRRPSAGWGSSSRAARPTRASRPRRSACSRPR